MVVITALQAASIDGNEHIPPAIISGTPYNFRVSSVIMPNVPSEPTSSRVKSYPAAVFFAREPVRIIRPSAITASSASTLSFIVPYLTAFVPEARVAAIPPSEALAPGSIGKNRPVSLRYSFNASLVTPGWTTASKSSVLTLSTLFISLVSIHIPPKGALT